jgi:hypothetical protein
MLFVPKYDPTVRTLPVDPFFFNSALRENDLAYVYHPNHNLMDRSTVTIAGATAIGSLTPAMINGDRPVVAIFNKNAYVVKLGGPLIENDITNGGGTAVTVTPLNDETIGYVYEYNKDLKIRRWTRYRDLNFGCGAVSQRGIIYLAATGRIYQFGTKENPIHADEVGNYDTVPLILLDNVSVTQTTSKYIFALWHIHQHQVEPLQRLEQAIQTIGSCIPVNQYTGKLKLLGLISRNVVKRNISYTSTWIQMEKLNLTYLSFRMVSVCILTQVFFLQLEP